MPPISAQTRLEAAAQESGVVEITQPYDRYAADQKARVSRLGVSASRDILGSPPDAIEHLAGLFQLRICEAPKDAAQRLKVAQEMPKRRAVAA